MARFFTLASSSSGNSCYTGDGVDGILIDAGISCRAIETTLYERGIDIQSLRGVFITHEHGDHIKGLKILTKKYPLKVYSSTAILEYLAERDLIGEKAEPIAIENRKVNLHNLEVESFATSHDSLESYGYKININHNATVVIATDTGQIPQCLGQYVQGCDLLMLESNYDFNMLQCGPYPYYLKKRIAGEKGHLSNEQCAQAIGEFAQMGVSRFVLGHLSKENNMPVLAHQTTCMQLEENHLKENLDYILKVAPAAEPLETIIF